MPRGAPPVLTLAVEGIVDEAILTRLVIDAGATVGPVYGKNGKSQLKKTLTGYNNAARYSPWLVLMDLDQDEECAPPLVSACLAAPAPMMRLRVAVRAIEAWILADRDGLAKFLSVAISRLPHDPDAVPDPKRFLVDLARNSRRRDIRDDMVPRSGSGRTAGPAYASRLIEFAVTAWRPKVAVAHSDSLRRCCDCIADLVRSLPA